MVSFGEYVRRLQAKPLNRPLYFPQAAIRAPFTEGGHHAFVLTMVAQSLIRARGR
jgi:hypothetical protein